MNDQDQTGAAPRDIRQTRVLTWVSDTFGAIATDQHERCARFIEEAIELAQSVGMPGSRVTALVDHVYSRPAGEARQEAGGVGITLLALCEVIGVSADGAEQAEFARVLSIDRERFRARQNVKADAGVAIRVDEAEGRGGK